MTYTKTIKKVIGLLQELIKEEEQEVQANLIAQQCVQAVSEIQAIPPVVEIPEKGDIVVPEINKLPQMPAMPSMPPMPQMVVKKLKTPNLEKIHKAMETHGYDKCILTLEKEGYCHADAIKFCAQANVKYEC